MAAPLDLQPIPLRHPHIQTSLVEVTNKLPYKPPCRIFFKNELEQPCGSFKLRGIGNLVRKSIEKARSEYPNKTIHVYASSGGNAGLAAGYSAYFYKVKCTVVLPVISKQSVRDKLKSYGADIILFGNTINEADQHLRNLINSVDSDKVYPIYCHPFNNPLIWEGHASLVDEVAAELGNNIRGMVCSFGGGGLYNGIYQGMQNNNMNSEILLIETLQAPTLTKTLEADKIITLKSVNSLATSLACSHTTEKSLQYFKNKTTIKSKLATIDDIDSLRACVEFNKNLNLVVEPACGAALAVAYNRIDLLYKSFENLHPNDIIVVVACGGSCTTEQDIVQFEKMIKRSENKL